MIDYDESEWRNNKLYVRNKNTGISIGPDQKYLNLYRVAENSWISLDYYNLTRAKDNAMRMYQGYKNKRPERDLGDAHGDV